MLWYKRWTDRRSNAQLHRVGFWGTVVFDALCDISAERDFHGVIPAEYLEVDFLIKFIGILPEELPGTGDPNNLIGLIEQGLEDVKRVKLVSSVSNVSCVSSNVSSVSDIFWRIDGWERRQPKPTQKSTDRVRKHRERLEKQNATTRNMFHDVSETHETHETSLDKIREDKKRIDKKEKKADALSPQKSAISEFQKLWNEKAHENLPRVQAITPKRQKAIQAFGGIERFGEVLTAINESTFLTCQFKATFDWVLKPENALKILEGNYRNDKQNKPFAPEPKAERPRGLTPTETAELRKDQAPRPIEFIMPMQSEVEYEPDFDIDGGIE